MSRAWALLDGLTLALLLAALALVLYGLWELAVTDPASYPFGAEEAGWVYRSPSIYLLVLVLEAVIAAAALAGRRWLRRPPARAVLQALALAAVAALHL